MLLTDQTITLSLKQNTFPQQDWKHDSEFHLYKLHSTKSYSIQRYVQLEVSISEIEIFLLGLHSKPEQHIPNTKQVGTKG